ncbi:MAG: hypothetical protein ACOWW1_05665 [archaeon]
MLGFGYYPARIAKKLGKSKGTIAYYVKQLEKCRYIEKEENLDKLAKGLYIGNCKGVLTLYRVTQAGSNFIARIENGVFERCLRLHNLYMKYPILEAPSVEIDWRRVQLNNWSQLIGVACGLTVRKNTDSFEIIASVMDGTNAYELLLKAKDECDSVVAHLEGKFRMVLGRGELSRKPHFGVYDPIAGKFTKSFELSTDIGKMDESEGLGERDYYNPDDANAHMHMPHDIWVLKKQVNSLQRDIAGQHLDLDDIKKILGDVVSVVGTMAEALKCCEPSVKKQSVAENVVSSGKKSSVPSRPNPNYIS